MNARRTWKRACVAATLMALALPGAASAADGVYWTTGSAVRTGGLDGTGAADLFTLQSSPGGLAIDAAAGRIYWASILGGAIRAADLDGTGVVNLYTDQDMPIGLAIDPAGGKVYWAAGGEIRVGDLDGGGPAATLFAGEDGPRGIAVDPAAGKIYWANTTVGGTVRVANLDGSGTPATLFGGEAGPSGVAVDPAAGKIYWVNDSGTVRTGNLDGSGTPATLYAGESNPRGVAVDPAASKIYWTSVVGAAVRVGDLDGSDPAATLFAELGSNFLALLRAPAATTAPAVTGDGELGHELSCGPGGWATDVGGFVFRAPAALEYQWLRDGDDVPTATSATLTPDEPGAYSCRVTATNHAGSTAQTSAPLAVSAPPPDDPEPEPEPEPPAPPPTLDPSPPSATAIPAILRLALAPRCVRRSASGSVRVRMRLRLATTAPVRVRIDRAVGTGAMRACPAPDPARRFDGDYRRAGMLPRVATRPLATNAATAAAGIDRQLAVRLRLAPGLYRVTVRAHDADGRLSRPVRRFLRVLG